MIDNDNDAVEAVVEVISNHRLAIIPTDTIYGLICDATSSEAVDSIYTLKKRDKKKRLGILLPSISEAEKFVLFTHKEIEILDRFGGRVTLIKKCIHPDIFCPELINDNGEIGIRIPDHKFCKKVLERFARPIAATSVNISGESESDLSLISESFLSGVSVIVRGGTSNISSSVIRCNGVEIETIRGTEIDGKTFDRL